MQYLNKEYIEGETIDDASNRFVYIHREGFINFLHLYMNFSYQNDLSFNVDISSCTKHKFPIKTEFKIAESIIKGRVDEINRFIVFF